MTGEDPCMEGTAIDYIIQLLDIPRYYYLIAAVMAVLVGGITRKWSLGLLAGYCEFVLAVTVFNRVPAAAAQYELRLFWSYAHPELWLEDAVNVAAYVPVGALGARLWGRRAVFFGLGLSAVSELLQLMGHRGLCELDDWFHNTVGTVLGCLAFLLVWRLMQKKNPQQAEQKR